MKPVWLLSDVHLTCGTSSSSDSSNSNHDFIAFLRGIDAAQLSSLYILGDLFDVWIGDDNIAKGGAGTVIDQVCDAIAALTARGVPVFIQHGNRDFMLGMRFARRCGVTLLPELHALHAHGENYLLAHGDSLVDDAPYLRYRRVIRHPITLAIASLLPLFLRRWLAIKMRAASRGGRISAVINHAAAAAALRRHDCKHLLHGHLHRTEQHRWHDNDEEYQRWCLPAWEEGGGYIELAAATPPRLVLLSAAGKDAAPPQ